jgi:hypothetical protein
MMIRLTVLDRAHLRVVTAMVQNKKKHESLWRETYEVGMERSILKHESLWGNI